MRARLFPALKCAEYAKNVSQHCIAGEIDDYMGTADFTVARNGFIISQEERRQRFILKNLMYYICLLYTSRCV